MDCRERYTAPSRPSSGRGTYRGTRACWRPIAAPRRSPRPTTAPTTTRRPLPQAVLLPGSAGRGAGHRQDLQKHGIKFKASIDLLVGDGLHRRRHAIQLDMRRMRSIEIDEKNMFAIIEPYAIGAVVQAEAMKVGLNDEHARGRLLELAPGELGGLGGLRPDLDLDGLREREHARLRVGAGERRAPQDRLARRRLGVVLRRGPRAEHARRASGLPGEHGLPGRLHEDAIRLHPWPGPTYIPSRGTVPAYKADLPDNFKGYTLCFPTWDDTPRASPSSTRTTSSTLAIGSSTCSAETSRPRC